MHDHMRLNPTIDRAAPEALGDRFLGYIHYLGHDASNASISLRSGAPWQYAIAGWRGFGKTAGRYRVDPGRGSKPTGGKIPRDSRAVEIALRHARHEARRIVWERGGEGRGHRIGELVRLDPVPDIEKEYAARCEHASRIRKCPDFFGEEHHSKRAHNHVERFSTSNVSEGKPHRIGLPPLHGPAGSDPVGVVQHRLVQIPRDDSYVCWQEGSQLARHDAGASGDLEYARRRRCRHSAGQIRGVGFEDQGNQMSLVQLGYRAAEHRVAFRTRHDALPPSARTCRRVAQLRQFEHSAS
jgi:hypothetical protein